MLRKEFAAQQLSLFDTVPPTQGVLHSDIEVCGYLLCIHTFTPSCSCNYNPAMATSMTKTVGKETVSPRKGTVCGPSVANDDLQPAYPFVGTFGEP